MDRRGHLVQHFIMKKLRPEYVKWLTGNRGPGLTGAEIQLLPLPFGLSIMLPCLI